MAFTCSNCGTQFTSPYCPDCGQKAGVGRLTLHNIVHELWHGFTHTDKGILRLWSDLLLRPATAYHNYFNGKRKSYFSPVVFFLLSFGFYIFFDQKVFDYQDHVNLIQTGHLYNNEVGRYVQEHSKYMALVLLPIESLLTWLLFYKRYNLAECITFWLLCVAFSNTILTLLTPVRLLFINYKATTDYLINLISIAIFLWHGVAVFGKPLLNNLKIAIIVLLISIASVYNIFYFLGLKYPVVYPTFWQSIKIVYADKSVSYYKGKFTIEE